AVTRRGPQGNSFAASSSSGNLYAGRDGNVYRNQRGSWQTYENGSWNNIQRSATGQRNQNAASSTIGQLNRDKSPPTQRPQQRKGPRHLPSERRRRPWRRTSVDRAPWQRVSAGSSGQATRSCSFPS